MEFKRVVKVKIEESKGVLERNAEKGKKQRKAQEFKIGLEVVFFEISHIKVNKIPAFPQTEQ